MPRLEELTVLVVTRSKRERLLLPPLSLPQRRQRRRIHCCRRDANVATWAALIAAVFTIAVAGYALAADTGGGGGISIGGQDASANMKDVQNLLTTIQTIGMRWVAKVIGGFLVVTGFWKIAVRDFMSGIVATGGGGSLFFIEKIADSLSKMSGS